MASARPTLNLALQGGGAHGAYTWGILDRLLEDGRVCFEGVTATSAGSVNAVALAYGLQMGGGETAREKLHDVWGQVAEQGKMFSPIKKLPWEYFMFGSSSENTLSFTLFEMMTRVVSPYQFNPINFNPLRTVLEKTIDFEALQTCNSIKIFITATNVRTGTSKVFGNEDMNVDVVLASACLPFLFQAVEIGGENYWDGGYMGNPSLWPLAYHTRARDILILYINPIKRDSLPMQAHDIMNRINEISFNSSLLKELRAISFVEKLIDRKMLKDEFMGEFKSQHIHAIGAEGGICDLSVASKFNTDWEFLTFLRDAGREQASEWLEENFHAIGKTSTVDIRTDFLSREEQTPSVPGINDGRLEAQETTAERLAREKKLAQSQKPEAQRAKKPAAKARPQSKADTSVKAQASKAQPSKASVTKSAGATKQVAAKKPAPSARKTTAAKAVASETQGTQTKTAKPAGPKADATKAPTRKRSTAKPATAKPAREPAPPKPVRKRRATQTSTAKRTTSSTAKTTTKPRTTTRRRTTKAE